MSDLQFKAQAAVPLIYNGRRTKEGYRIDFLVEERVVVEVKAERRIQLLGLRTGSNLFEVNASAGWADPQLQHSVDEEWHRAGRQSCISPLS